MNDETIEDDLRRRHELEMLRARNPKVAKIEARRDIKIARTNSEYHMFVRNTLVGVLGAAMVMLGISGCSVMVWGNDEPKTAPSQEQVEQERKDDLDRYMQCTAAGGKYDEGDNTCYGT